MTDHSTGPAVDGHLDHDTLADLDEDLLDPAETATARQHLASCAACAAEARALAAVPGRLAAAAGTGPIPADVARRIGDALAAEPPVEVGGSATVTPLPAVGSRPGGLQRPPRGMRLLQAAAALVLVLAGVGVAVSAIQGGGDDAADMATESSAGAAGGSARADDGTFPVTASGRDWTEDTVVAAVPELVAGTLGSPARTSGGAGEDSGAPGDDSESPAASNPPEPRLADNAAARLAGGPPLSECVTALNDDPVTPLAVDIATWKGDPAAVILLPTPADPTAVDQWVVAADCSLADAKVLYFARVARP